MHCAHVLPSVAGHWLGPRFGVDGRFVYVALLITAWGALWGVYDILRRKLRRSLAKLSRQDQEEIDNWIPTTGILDPSGSSNSFGKRVTSMLCPGSPGR